MKVIILAAGRGSRLGNMTEALPKGMVELGGTPLLTRHIERLQAAGVSDIALVTGYLPDRFPYDLTRFHNPHWADTQMVASLRQAHPWLESDECLIAYADILYDAEKILGLLNSQQHPLVMPYFTGWKTLWEERIEEPLSDLESFKLKSDHTLLEIGKRPGSYADIEGQFMGLLKTTPEGWNWIESLYSRSEMSHKMDMTRLLNGLLESGKPIHTCAYEGFWLEVDTPEDHALYEKQYVEGRLPLL